MYTRIIRIVCPLWDFNNEEDSVNQSKGGLRSCGRHRYGRKLLFRRLIFTPHDITSNHVFRSEACHFLLMNM